MKIDGGAGSDLVSRFWFLFGDNAGIGRRGRLNFTDYKIGLCDKTTSPIERGSSDIRDRHQRLRNANHDPHRAARGDLYARLWRLIDHAPDVIVACFFRRDFDQESDGLEVGYGDVFLQSAHIRHGDRFRIDVRRRRRLEDRNGGAMTSSR